MLGAVLASRQVDEWVARCLARMRRDVTVVTHTPVKKKRARDEEGEDGEWDSLLDVWRDDEDWYGL